MNIHFIAIGGAIMHQLAIALHHKGYVITGSDDEINNPAKDNLAAVGLLPSANGWFPEKINASLDGIILGMHAKADNPELLAAQALNIPIYSFPEYIYKVSEQKQRVVVAGSHGKTTTTSMIMHALKENNVDFDYMVGAKVAGFEQSVKLSDAPIIVLEGDEYPASVIEKRPKIHFYKPDISILTGIAWDHVNVFPTYENYFHQFELYLNDFNPATRMVYCGADSEVVRLIEGSNLDFIREKYDTPHFEVVDNQSVIVHQGKAYTFAIFGKHNMQNMEAARKVCNALGIADDTFYQAMTTFEGAARRFEKLSERDGFVAFRDFAHAPSKLKATLAGARKQFSNHKLIGVFELHTYSSLSAGFIDQYRDTLAPCDASAVFFSKHALQLKRLPELATTAVQTAFNAPESLVTTDAGELKAWIEKEIQNVDQPVCLLLMSSGTFEGMDLNF